MSERAMTLEEYYSPNKMLPFAAAFGFHLFLLMWDPTILKSTAMNLSAPLINIKVMDKFMYLLRCYFKR